MTDDTELQTKLDQALASIKALEAKNSEILAEKKKAKEEADSAREAAEAAEAEKAANSTSVDEVKAALAKQHTKDLKKLQDQLDGTNSQLTTVLIDNTIKDQLVKHNVAPQFHKAVSLILKDGAKLENGEAMVNGVPLTDHITSFVGSDEGKHFVAAPVNTGAGATGSKQEATNVSSGEFSFTNYTNLKRDGKIVEAKAYAEQHGKSF